MDFLKKYGFYLLLAFVVIYFVGRYLYAQPKYINGEIATDFKAPLRDGSPFQLSQLRGQYVLIDFWGSWCGPCIREMPAIKGLYDKYHNRPFKDAKGFEIVSVGVETDKARWENAIQVLGMNWHFNMANFEGMNSPIAKLYGVRVIPTKFLLNTEGVVVGVNQSMEQIDAFLASKSE